MKTSSAKNKGRLLQKWVVENILQRFKKLKPDDVRSASMGQTGEDVLLSPAARKYVPYQFECKSLASFSGYKIMEQADNHGEYPSVVVVRANRKQPLVILHGHVFFDLIKELNNNETNKAKGNGR